MSKTAQRKKAAYEKGYKDGLTSQGHRWKSRIFKGDYEEGLRIGKMDRRWNALTPEQRVEENKRARERARELGPEPTEY